MTKGANHNHPKKGSVITVDPIKSIEDINKIKHLLKDHPRNYAIFIIGINTNLRASDLVELTVGQVRNLKPMDVLTLREKKTKKLRRINLNNVCIEAIKPLIRDRTDTEPLFASLRGTLRPNTINALVKGWCKAVNLQGNFGSHTLRKTFGFVHRVVNHVSWAVLSKMFNHSSQEETRAYLCIQGDEIEAIYANEI